jgi:hypothetical protein
MPKAPSRTLNAERCTGLNLDPPLRKARSNNRPMLSLLSLSQVMIQPNDPADPRPP